MTLLEQSNELFLLSEFPLLPCGPTTKVPSGKAPIDPQTGFNLSKWEGTSYTPEDLLDLNGCSDRVTSVGINHALSYRDGFCNIDLDGLSTLDKAKEFGCSSTQPGWIIGRDTSTERLKVPFFIPEDLRHHFDDSNGNPVGKVVLTTKPAEYDLDDNGKPKRDDDGKLIKLKDSEQIELFWATGQTVVLGQHIPSGGQYTWRGNPTATDAPTPEWWAFILHILEEGQKQSKPQKSGNSTAEVIQSGPGEPCLICGRDTSGACTKYTDGERVRINCFEGQTFNPIDTHGTLTNGQTIEGSDGKTYACCGSGFNGSIGSFAKFVEHIELPKQKLSKKSSGTGTNHEGIPGFICLANNTLEDLKNGIEAINKLSSPAARTVAQFSLRGELGLSPDAYKQIVQDLLEEQDTPAPTSFEELMKLDTGKEASIDDLAAKGSLTLVAAEGHAGKTSLFYRMAEAISTGENFAGRFKTTRGKALLYQVDESPTDAINKFRRMSLAPDNDKFLPRWKLSPSMIPELEQDIKEQSPVAVFADSLMRIFGGRGISLNDAEFGIWLYQLNNIASKYGTSFFLSHHLKKPENQKRGRVSKHDLFGTAFLFNGTSDCWGLYPSQEEGARSDEFCLEFLKARSGMQDVGTTFNLQGSIEDYSWEMVGIQGQAESLEEKKLFADEVRDLLKLKGGHWSSQQVADYFKVSNERARKTLIKLYELRCGIDRSKRASIGGRPSWAYFSTSSRV